MSSLLLGLSLLLAAPAPKEAVKPAASIEGEWTLVSRDGGQKKEVVPGLTQFIFTANQIEVHQGSQMPVEKAKYSVDLKAKPAIIDITRGEISNEKVVHGILEISGEAMKLCYARDGQTRPTEFKGDPAKSIEFFTFKRSSPGK